MTPTVAKTDTKTRTFSLRLTDAEHQRIREIANRLGSSESAVMRYAIRSMLRRTGPLSEPHSSAYSLIPVFVEHGEELISYFDLDSASLNRIINGKTADEEQQVDAADLTLLSASGLGKPHVQAKLRELQAHEVSPGDVPSMLRGYFYNKYIYEAGTTEE